MKRQIFLILFIVLNLTQNLFGQIISNVDFNKIKSTTQDSLSNQYYPLLIQRFQSFDTTLTDMDHKLIYYGNVFTKKYNPYGIGDDEEKFTELYKQKKYREAIYFGQEVIKENSVNIKILHKILLCYHKLGDGITAKKYANMYFKLLSVIYNSGDGKSIESAFVVIKVADEYEVLYDLELIKTNQALVGETDILTINTKNQEKRKGQKKIKELYFNVSRSFDYLHKQFKNK